jgi:hypothetical protein
MTSELMNSRWLSVPKTHLTWTCGAIQVLAGGPDYAAVAHITLVSISRLGSRCAKHGEYSLDIAAYFEWFVTWWGAGRWAVEGAFDALGECDKPGRAG